MDVTMFIGMAIAMVLMVFGMGLKNLANFVDMQSFIIVIIGTVAALFAGFGIKSFKQLPKHIKLIMSKDRYNAKECITQIVDMAQVARKKGLLALEEESKKIEDPFFKQSLILIVDVPDASRIKEMLENELLYLDERHAKTVTFYETGEALAPAFGMIGTLIGLVNMLKSMSMDSGGSSSIGEDMSVALITTLYGVIFANIVFGPIVRRLKQKHDEEILFKNIIIEGVLAIQAGDNPKFLNEKLTSYLAHYERSDGGGDEGGEKSPKAKKGKKSKE
ncbi:motility protein A [Proteocatella sphenisci]|uniref:motility protein A n=1 Tax=Proteocatella sphenisci TaxID=181070 RepID=UPI00048BDFBD|nr:MotA/TolQ/ExbB proton channel family protein [Proteocatella sphenisci]